jgi:hypothetical protein
MATISDYVVLANDPVTLRAGGEASRSLPFAIPNTASIGSASILSWQFEAEASPNNLKWQFDVNGRGVASFTHNADRFCAIQEVMGSNVLKHGNNVGTIRLLSGEGQIKLSAVVVHYQANV